ncbi:hypothetical protein [Erwinia sp. MYb416]|uniref:hypothetical protein n=1 Tax=Erwinia sp. MYb416 TaxID=3108532 RepID=UPI0030B0BD26
MSYEELSELQILQQRLKSAEVLLTLVFQHLSENQKIDIESALDEKIEQWKDEVILKEVFDGANNLINNRL